MPAAFVRLAPLARSYGGLRHLMALDKQRLLLTVSTNTTGIGFKQFGTISALPVVISKQSATSRASSQQAAAATSFGLSRSIRTTSGVLDGASLPKTVKVSSSLGSGLSWSGMR